MNLRGKVVDQQTGQPLVNVTIWEIMPDGQSAEIIGNTAPDGSYNIEVSDPASVVNFVIDNYLGLQLPVAQVQNSDQVLLAKDGSFTAKVTFSGVPAWLWAVAAFSIIYFLQDEKKRR